MSIAARILERYQRYGWSELEGEWGHIHDTARREYHHALDTADEETLTKMLGAMFQTSIVWGLVTFDVGTLVSEENKQKFVTLSEENLAVWSSHTSAGPKDLRRLDAPKAGGPAVVHFEDVRVMFDTPRHDHYAQRISDLTPGFGRVVEIGGGYGGTALQLRRARDDVQVVIVDLPETLYLAWYWLTEAGVHVAWWDEDPEADVLLVPNGEVSKIQNVDLVFNAHSFSEMPLEVVKNYLAWVERVEPRYLYHDNAHLLNPLNEFSEVRACDMVPGEPYRELYRAPTVWPEMGVRYWEFLYERGET